MRVLKTYLALSSLLLFLMASKSGAVLSIEFQVGTLLDSQGAGVSDGSIWALIYDEDGDGFLPGGLDVSVSSSLTAANAPTAFDNFKGQTIEADAMIDGDRILQVFLVDGQNTSGISSLSIQENLFSDTEWQAIGNKNWAIYWFPGLTLASNTLSANSAFEIGGIREINAGSGGDIGMQFPAFVIDSGPFYVASFLDNTEDILGDIPVSRFTAISVIPEPSAMVLSLLGSALLLRRRRA